MARLKGEFSLYKRTNAKNKVTYYAKIHSDNPAEPVKKISTGQSSKTSAALWVQRYLDNLANEEKRKEEERLNITFSEFAEGFWAHDGLYAVGRRARLRTVSQGFLDNRNATTENHIIPQWGKYRLRDISPKKIDRWVIDMASDNRIAPGTVNQRLQVLRVMLEEACKQEYITENPAQFVKPVGGDSAERGVLSLTEVRALLNPMIWADYKYYAITLLTLATGLRISEVRGLQISQVQPDHVKIHTAWEEKYGLKEPKCGSLRELPITPMIYEALQEVIKATGATHLVFFGKNPTTPISKSWIAKQLYRALERIGIDEESMTERYTHFRLENYQEISQIQETMLG